MRAYFFWSIIIVSLFFIWQNPFWGVVSYSAMNLVRPEMFFWGGDTGAKALKITYGFTLISILARYSNFSKNSFIARETILLAWLYIAILISIVLSDYTIDSVYKYANEIGKLLLFCCIMFLTIDSKEKVIRYEAIMLGAFVFLGLWGIDQHFRGNARLEGLGGHAFPDTNGIAAIFILFFPVALNFIFYSTSKLTKISGMFAALVVLVLIIFTQSRGGFLGLLVAGYVSIMRFKQKFKVLLCLALLVVGVVPFLSSEYIARLQTIKPSEDGELESSANSRLYLWQAGLMVFADNPVVGTGFMTYPVAKMKYEHRFMALDPEFRSYIFREENKKVTHNTYIQLLSDCGLFGAVPFYLFLFGTFRQNFLLRKKLKNKLYDVRIFNLLNGVEAGIIGYSVSIFFIDSVTMVLMPWQVVMCAIMRRLLQKDLSVVTK